MCVWSTEVADKFIELSMEEDVPLLTHLHIQKMIYISHGWMLSFYNRGLTAENPEAWKHGPVYRAVWECLRYSGFNPIVKRIKDKDLKIFEKRRKMDDNENLIVKKVYDTHKNLNPFQLVRFTHRKGSPWYKTYFEKGINEDILSSDIKVYFNVLRQGSKHIS